jgi:D-alanyl-D-alanine carboxypeptidase
LWKYPFATGGKTGFTKTSGRCFVSSAKKDGATLVAVTLNAPDDWNDHMKLLDYGFDKLEMTEIIEQNQILCTRKIGSFRTNILASSPVFLPLKNGKKHSVTCRIRIIEPVPEDISFGTPLGYGDIYVDDFCCGSVELISGQDLSAKKSSNFHLSLRNLVSKFVLSYKKAPDS